MDHPAACAYAIVWPTDSKIERKRGRSCGRVLAFRRAGSASVRPLHQLHREEGPTVGEGSQLVDRNHARVLQLAADLGFLDEPTDQVGLRRGAIRAAP